MDRNQVTGLLLILLMLTLYFQFFGPTPPKEAKNKTNTVQPATPATVTPAAAIPGVISDSLARQQYGSFAAGASGEAKDVVLENNDLKVTLSTKGGRVKEVLLKNYFTFDKKPLVLLDERTSNMALEVATPQGKIDLAKLYFSTAGQNTVVPTNDSSTIVFRLAVSPTQYIEQTYTLGDKGFQLGYDLKFVGLTNEIKNEPVRVHWVDHLRKLEKDLEQNRTTSTVNYYTVAGDFNQLSESSTKLEEKLVEEPIQWISLKQKFFNAALIAKTTAFQKATLRTNVNVADINDVKTLEASLLLPVADLKAGKGNFQFYFGPNNYQVVKKVTDGFGNNVNLGWPVVKLVNRFVIVPLFNFLETFNLNYGLIIILVVLIVKLVLTPLTYKSYISMAKMRVLQPELAEIKAKTDGDAVKAQQEQMKLYQQVGVSPLSGCVPVLLQMPILLAMFSFFPNSIELRQESFLWAPDLSTYDSVLNLPFSIPFYGAHVSLFAILMTLSSIAYAYFNNQMTTVEGPMKTMGYIMPVMFLFIMNKLPAGLSFYYLVSNLVTIGQQVLIRRFVDEDKIRAVLDENRKNSGTRKKSKFQTRLEEAMKGAEEAKKKK